MPQLRMTALNGKNYTITSSSPDTIARWLREVLPMVVSGDPYANECHLSCWPMYGPDGQADWPGGAWRRDDVLRAEDGERICQLLDQIHAERYAKEPDGGDVQRAG